MGRSYQMNLSAKHFVIGIFLGLMILPFILKTDNAYYQEKINKPQVTEAPTPRPTPTVSLPQRLIIEKLAINTALEYVGLEGAGAMGVPQDFDNVAWYQDGPKPGEVGNAVIAGHLDRVTGDPAVFYYLSSLQIGDQIFSVAQDGKVYTFIVKDKKIYPYNQVPLEEVFGEYSGKRLNLITCQGIFNQRTQNYSNRIVIYTELLEN